MRRLVAGLSILVGGVVVWLLLGQSPDTAVRPAAPAARPAPAPRRPAELDRPTLHEAPSMRAAPPPGPAADPQADADDALVGTLEALLAATDDCAFTQFADVVDLDVVDPAFPVRAMLEHGTHPSDAPYVRDAMEHAASSLQELLETEGCWP